MTELSRHLIRDSEHVQELIRLVQNADGAIHLVSPWVAGDVLQEILGNTQSPEKVTLTVRWPQGQDTPTLLDIDALRHALGLGVRVCWLVEPIRLHAKVYFVERVGAIITSANLTDSGCGRSGAAAREAAGNLELGVRLTDRASMKEVERWIASLKSSPLETEHLKELDRWAEQHTLWSQSVEEGRPEPPAPPVPAVSVALEGLEFAKTALRVLRDYTHIRKGSGRKAFDLDLSSRYPHCLVRVCTSVHAPDGPDGSGRKYHFGIPRRDVEAWRTERKSRGRHLRGIVLVPCETVGGKHLFPSADPWVVFLPFDYLFGHGNVAVTPFLSRNRPSDTTPTLFVTREGDSWVLQTPSEPGKSIALDGCLNATREFKRPRTR